MKRPTKLKKMELNSVDFVGRGANPKAHIMLRKSATDSSLEEEKQSFIKSLIEGIKKAFGVEENEDTTQFEDITKSEDMLVSLTDTLGKSFSSIAKDETMTQAERISMIAKSVNEFVDTLDGCLSSYDIEKSSYEEPKEDNSQITEVTQKSDTSKGEDEMSKYENVNKNLLTDAESAVLEALIAKASGKEVVEEPPKEQPNAQEGDELPPAVKKALQQVEEMKKSYEMRELETVAKKYEILGKKVNEEAQILYDLKKSGEENYNAYIAAMDAQVSMVEKSGLFAEIGKSGNYNYGAVTKSEPEAKVEAIAKSLMENDPTLDYFAAVTKAYESNPELFNDYEQQAGF